jgi:hypothetical protein
MGEDVIIHSETITKERTFEYSLRLGENHEIISAQETFFACAECENSSFDNEWYCPDHPYTTVLTVISHPDLVETPINLGDMQDMDVVLFLPESNALAGSFGFQIRRGENFLQVADLDGEQIYSNSMRWIIPNKVPAEIAEYAKLICG